MRNMDVITESAETLLVFVRNFDEQKLNDHYCEKLCPKRMNHTCPVINHDGKCPNTPEQNCISFLNAESKK